MKTKFYLTLLLLAAFISSNAQNVGIGTAAPAAKHHIVQTATAVIPGQYININNTSAATASTATPVAGPKGLVVDMIAGAQDRGILLNHRDPAASARGMQINMLGTTVANSGGLLIFQDGADGSRGMTCQVSALTNNDVTAFFSHNGTATGTRGITSGTAANSDALAVHGNAGWVPTPGSISSVAEPLQAFGVQGVGQGPDALSGYGVGGISITAASTPSTTGAGLSGKVLNLGALTVVTETEYAVRASSTNYKALGISGSPTVSTSREDHTGKKVILFCPEAPMPLYEDWGKGRLVNGRASVQMDPAFMNMVYAGNTPKDELRIIIQMEGDCKGVYVANKRGGSFDVVELDGGKSNANFTYHVVGNAKDYYYGPNKEMVNKLQDVRFPELPANFIKEKYTAKEAVAAKREAQD